MSKKQRYTMALYALSNWLYAVDYKGGATRYRVFDKWERLRSALRHRERW